MRLLYRYGGCDGLPAGKRPRYSTGRALNVLWHALFMARCPGGMKGSYADPVLTEIALGDRLSGIYLVPPTSLCFSGPGLGAMGDAYGNGVRDTCQEVCTVLCARTRLATRIV